MPSPQKVITTAVAARVLGVSAAKLRRWIREGRFAHLGDIPLDPRPGFVQQRAFTREWIAKVAVELQVEPDWAVLVGFGHTPDGVQG